MTRTRGLLFILAAAHLLSACGPSPWEQAKSADTVEALEAFVNQHPDSEFVDEAVTRIDTLKQQHWDGVAEVDTLEAYVDFVRSGPDGDYLNAAREAVMALHAENWAATSNGNIEFDGGFGPSGMIEEVEAVTVYYDGTIATLPASVRYSVSAGVDADGEQQFFAFRDGDNILSVRSDAAVAGTVTIETPEGEFLEYELFGLVKAPDDDLAGSFLVGKGPDLLWSNVEGMTVTPGGDEQPGVTLEANEAVLFAVSDNLALAYVP